MSEKPTKILFQIIKDNKDENSNRNNIWSKKEDSLLLNLVDFEKQKGNKINWRSIALNFNKDFKKCYYRYRHINPELKKGYWTNEEEEKLKKLIKLHGQKWSLISKEFGTRSGKQIRHHYINISDNRNKLRFTDEERKKLIKLYNLYGSDWKLISKFFNGRTPDNLKACFNNLNRNKNKLDLENLEISMQIYNESKATNNNLLSDKVVNSDLCINIQEKTINTDKIQCAYDTFYNIHFNNVQPESHPLFLNPNYNYQFNQNYKTPFDDDHFHTNNFLNNYNNTIESNFLKENDNNMEILSSSKI